MAGKWPSSSSSWATLNPRWLMMPIYEHRCKGKCVAWESRNRDRSECSSLREQKGIFHLQRKALFLLGNFANGEGEISRRWEYPFFPYSFYWEHLYRRNLPVTAMALFQQKMMLIYIQNFSILDWKLCYRVKALLQPSNFRTFYTIFQPPLWNR